MNRDKGFFRLAIVLSPVFGIVVVGFNVFFALDLQDRDLNHEVSRFFGNGDYKRYRGDRLDVERVGNPTLVQRVHGYMKGYDGNKYPLYRGVANVIAFLFGGNIPFFMYFSYKYVLAGFEGEDDLA